MKKVTLEKFYETFYTDKNCNEKRRRVIYCIEYDTLKEHSPISLR